MVRKRILNELFDIRPVAGNRLHWAWIAQVRPVLNLRGDHIAPDSVHKFTIIRASGYPETKFSLAITTPEGSKPLARLETATPKLAPQAPKMYTSPRVTIFRIVMAASFALFVIACVWGARASLALRRELLSGGSLGAEFLREGLDLAALGNYREASMKFSQARDAFRGAHQSLEGFSPVFLAALHVSPLGDSVSSGAALLEAGEELGAAAEILSASLDEAKVSQAPQNAVGGIDEWGTKALDLHEQFTRAGEHLDLAADALRGVNPTVFPNDARGDVETLKNTLPKFRKALGSFREAADAAFHILGFAEPREYLVLLQNSSELRPTGGFVGNVGLLRLSKGQVVAFTVRDAYDLDGQIVHHTVPPKPIQDISTAWSLHDANWFRHFPTSAKVSLGFFEEVTATKPDGVVAATSAILEDMLSTTGPIVLPSGEPFEASTAVDAISRLGLSQQEGETLQAHTMQQLSDALRTRLESSTPEVRRRLAALVFERMASGDIMAWFPDGKEQQFAESLGLSGALEDPVHDALAVAHANINGFKTDAVIRDTIALQTEITSRGEIINTVTVVRHHTFPKYKQDPLYGRVNKDYVRLYVPKGSELLEVSGITNDPYVPPIDYGASGFKVLPELEGSQAMRGNVSDGADVGEEDGRTVFGAWLFVSPGEEVRATFKYKLPKRLLPREGNAWTVVLERQPGNISEVRVIARAPEGFILVDRAGNKGREVTLYSGTLERSEVLGFSFAGE